jgi:ferredoxin
MDVEIRVDRTLCIGSGQCVHWAPGVFEQDEESISVVVDPRGEPEEKIVQAVFACPMQAISLRVGDTRVSVDDLKDWTAGLHSDDPVVARLEQLSLDHHELRAVLNADSSDDATPTATRDDTLHALTTTHLRDEGQVYSAIAELIGPDLVAPFHEDHVRIAQALDAVASTPAGSADRARALEELASAVDEHIALEETVLFPAALAELARRAAADHRR